MSHLKLAVSSRPQLFTRIPAIDRMRFVQYTTILALEHNGLSLRSGVCPNRDWSIEDDVQIITTPTFASH